MKKCHLSYICGFLILNIDIKLPNTRSTFSLLKDALMKNTGNSTSDRSYIILLDTNNYIELKLQSDTSTMLCDFTSVLLFKNFS